jgi:GNAT superfamily N-acetyltransferase
MALVRRAVLADAAGITAVHVASWESTYGDILPEAYLAARSVAVRLAFWTDLLAEGDPAICVFVACWEDGSVCGFASGGPGELYSLYLLDSAQGLGLGRRLVEAVLDVLDEPVRVWVLSVNPARGFYEHLGGRLLEEKRVTMGGEIYTEVAYDLGSHRGV